VGSAPFGHGPLVGPLVLMLVPAVSGRQDARAGTCTRLRLVRPARLGHDCSPAAAAISCNLAISAGISASGTLLPFGSVLK
jgi:hypothetical protein